MTKIISVINQKGGVGKTTTSINLASGLAFLKQKVLLIDYDPQGNASTGIGCYLNRTSPTVLEALQGLDINNVIYKTSYTNLDVIPSRISLSDIELGKIKIPNSEYMLKNLISKVKNKYDYIIIDCPPSLGVLSVSVLTATDSVIIPIQCEYLALEGATQLLTSIRDIQKTTNPKLRIEGILITMVDNRTRVSDEIQKEVRRHFKSKVYDTVIPRNVKLSECPAMGKSIYEYDIKSDGAKAYASFVKELISKNN